MRSCGGFALVRSLSSRMGRIVMYHDFCAADERNPDAVSVAAARAHLEHLSRHFRVVRLTTMAEQLASGQQLDSRAVALTIDDGRRNFYDYFFPLLREFQMPVTFFVVSSFVDGLDWIWTDKVLWLSKQAGVSGELAPANLPRFFRELNRQRPEERNRRIAALSRDAGVKIPQNPPAEYEPCSWRQLREMVASGLVDVGSHTVTHAILSSISDEESWAELVESRRRIQHCVDQPVLSFCPPNGTPADYRPAQLEQVKAAGYSCSVTTDFGFVSQHSDPYRLPRIGGGRSDRMVFYKRVDGPMYYRHRLRTLLGGQTKTEPIPYEGN